MRTLCQLEDIDPESGKEIMFSEASQNHYLALFRSGDSVVGYLNSCPHQGRSLNWAPDKFLIGNDGTLVCPHHGATFEITSGKCISGPCEGSSLTTVDIEVTEGQVLLATNTKLP